MALTITINGTGVLADADALTDNQGGSWLEDGGGTRAANVDVYLYAGATVPASIASKYASKSGYTYYEDLTTINLSTSGDLIYFAVNIQSNGAFLATGNPFNLVIGSSIGAQDNAYEWTVALKDNSNGWSGGWKVFCVDATNIVTGVVTTGTPDMTAADTFGLWIDTDVSVRAESIFISQLVAMKGISCTGTATTAGEGFNELINWCTDYTSRLVGVLEKRGETIFQKGGVLVGDSSTSTTLSAAGNSIECEESSFYNGSAWISTYPTDANYITTTANAALDFENVSYAGYIDNKLELDISLGNASSIVGGSLKLLRALSVKSTDTFEGVVFSTNDALSLGTASYDLCSFINCGTQTIGATITSFDNNAFKPATGIDALSTSSLNLIVDGTFTSGGTGHAVELTGAAGSYTWDCITTGYDAGTAADGVEVTGGSITGDETIHITASTGTFNISVNSGKTTPSVSSAGAIVNVTAGQATYTQTVIDKDTGVGIEGVAITILTKDGTGPFPYQDTVTITRATTVATVTHTAHGMKTGHKVKILGANENEFNRIKTITVTDANTYTYTVESGAGDATGTITSTAIIIDGLTNASGQIADTRGYGGTNQPITGTAKKGSGAPVYKSTPITGTIDSANGLSITTAMTKD